MVLPALHWENLLSQLGVEVVDNTLKILRYALLSGLWISLAWLCVRLIDLFIWQAIVERHMGEPVPKLLKDVVAVVVFGLAASGILGVVFDFDVTGIWATSGVLTVVIGFAIQSMIADVFSGIALNIDRPFKIGEWVTLHPRGVESITGRVDEINWRSTRIVKTDGNMVVLPNNLVGISMLTNLSRPAEISRFKQRFCLDFDVPTERALRILSAGARSAKGPLTDPMPKARVNGTTKWGVEYEIRYWLNPADVSPAKGRHNVASSVMEHLHQAGISLAHEKLDVFHAPMPPRSLDVESDRTTLIGRVELFSALQNEDLSLLASQMLKRTFTSGSDVVRIDDSGDSMYVLVEGLLQVFVPGSTPAQEMMVAQLIPGQFFGEMSLLTGEPRTATVRAATDAVMYEINKDHLTRLLEQRPEIAEELTRVVAERKVRTADRKNQQSQATRDSSTEAQTLASQLLRKMRGVFSNLNGKPARSKPEKAQRETISN